MKYLQYARSTFLAITLSAAAVAAQADSATRAITQAAFANNSQQLQTLADASSGYPKAYALYRLAQLGMGSPGAEIKALLDEATTLLRARKDAESMTLLAAVHNLSMGLNPSIAPQLSVEVAELLKTAQATPTARARALLIEGINRFYTPAPFGGGAEVARVKLREAEQLFAQSQSQESDVEWGEAETQIWLGQVAAALGEFETARAHYKKALIQDPGCLWANYYMGQLPPQ